MEPHITRVAARKCAARALGVEEANRFIEANHRQGVAGSVAKSRSVGIFWQDELVGVAQFCATRTVGKARKYTVELLRMCFKGNIRVMGGASKLLKFYISRYDPSDFFTYQDSSGENTSVYEHAGMTFVGQAKRKDYLVAPGKTLANASRKEALGLAYAVRYGPDRITGSRLGQVYREDGSRKSNIELFIEELGWHRESTAGDKVYEWINPNHTYYTYKITATDSPKYYYGVSHLKRPHATSEDCLNDGYRGSGGKKFSHWKSKHGATILEEVLRVFPSKAEAYLHEKDLVGDRYRTDDLCLNSLPGGMIAGLDANSFSQLSSKLCPIHGATTHRGDSCLRCVNEKTNRFDNCPLHGLTAFQGDSCAKCSSERAIVLRECPIHGEVKHQGNSCRKCVTEALYTVEYCPIHGEVSHRAGACSSCSSSASVSIRVCEIHGESKHIGESCYSCTNSSSVSEKLCATHGLSKHIGDTCYSCRSTGYYEDHCEIHGVSKHRGGKCQKCDAKSKLVASKLCTVCGESFTPANNRQKVCKGPHLVACPRCGDQMDYRKNHCSMSCAIRASNEKKETA